MTAPELAQLLDKQEITDRLAAYIRAADRIDLPALAAVFRPRAELDCGGIFTGQVEGFVGFVEDTHSAMAGHSRHLGSVAIRLDGDRATSEAYVRLWLRFPGQGEGVYRDVHSSGRYLDEWERHEGSWRIVRRRYLQDLEDSRTVTEGLVGGGGPRDRTDPSYRLLGD